MIDRRLFCGALGATTLGATLLGASALLPAAAQAQSKVVTIPITPASFGAPTIQVTIAGQGPFTFALDTGASFAIISPAVARQLKLIGTRDMMIGSLKGRNIARVYTVKEIILGGAIRVPEFEMAAVDEYGLPGLDGILPASFLTLLPCQLDFGARELRYYLGNARMDLDGFHEVDSFFHSDNPQDLQKIYIEVYLTGEKLLCCLDTAASQALVINADAVNKHKWWDAFPDFRESSSIGVNGAPLKTRIAIARDVTVGGLPLPAVPVVLSDPGDRQAKGMPYDGLIGIPFISHFTLAFDPKKYLYVKPRVATPAAG